MSTEKGRLSGRDRSLHSIGTIWAVGRNYADHARELGNTVPTPTERPLIFIKAGSCAVSESEPLLLPAFAEPVHFEGEIAFRFASDFSSKRGVKRLDAVTVALDLTARSLQEELKRLGQPWALAKSFRGSCPLGDWVALPSNENEPSLQIEVFLNGTRRQSGQTEQMIHSISRLADHVAEHFPVQAGDALLTGTPSGVGPLKTGDSILVTLRSATGTELISASWTCFSVPTV